ncbi:MAG: hypothetical protein ACE5QV_07475, partial [Fidelibacterota bacterium]
MNENSIIELTAKLIFQLSFILIGAKIGAELFERYLKQPPVLGELVVGLILGPFALGGILSIPGMPEGLKIL